MIQFSVHMQHLPLGSEPEEQFGVNGSKMQVRGNFGNWVKVKHVANGGVKPTAMFMTVNSVLCTC